MCDQSIGWPTEFFFGNLFTMNIMGVRAYDRFGF